MMINKRLIGTVSESKKYIAGNVFQGRIASGEIWNRESDRIMYIYKKYGTLCEEMETGAVYTIAKNFDIPVLGIRVITQEELLSNSI